jgi:hypothetical protein
MKNIHSATHSLIHSFFKKLNFKFLLKKRKEKGKAVCKPLSLVETKD